jgi:serine/threonine protein phosphatase 1
MRLGDAQIPDGLRIYAVGDVHGCDHLLASVHAKIDEDLASRPVAEYRVVHLGDYVDRGPDSAKVVERLSRRQATDERILCLRGNHEEMLLDFLADPIGAGQSFFANSGETTLASYGVSPERGMFSPRDLINLVHEFAMLMPVEHRKFLAGLPTSVRFGDFFFCHAGIRPGVALEDQDPFDLIWIREGFLDSGADFDVVVVHGHTPSPQPEIRPNRINIDTGAVMGGPLTCLVLEGKQWRFL